MAQEKNFETRVKDFLKSKKMWFIKYWAGAEFTKKGVPDILACVEGRFFGIEIKAPRGEPTPLQIYNLRQIHESGGYAILLYPDDFESFKNMVSSGYVSYGVYQQLQKVWLKWEDKFKEEGLL